MSASTNRWTPGPWAYVKGEFNAPGMESHAIGSIICDSKDNDEYGWYIATIENAPHSAANTAILLASPELYDALQRIVDAAEASEIGRVPKGLLDDAKAVLKKAEGR
jgi:hypothetical protein